MSARPDPARDLSPKVRVVVLNWNSHWFTRRCLHALSSTDHRADRLELVVVDNASIDGSLERLRDEFPTVRFVANAANLGFAEGCNRAMRDLSGVDWVALVNNDALPEPGWLAALLAAGDDPQVGAVAARLVLEPAFGSVTVDIGAAVARLAAVRVDGSDALGRVRSADLRSVGRTEWPMELIHHVHGRAELMVPAGPGTPTVELELVPAPGTKGSVELMTAVGRATAPIESGSVTVGVRLGEARTELLNGLGTDRNAECESFDRYFGVPDDPESVPELSEPPRTVTGFSGGGVLLRVPMLEQVGLFDPAYFAYYEDSDLSWRATRAGWRIVTAPDAVLRHSFGGSGGSVAHGFFFLNYRNWLLTALRNGTRDERRRALASARERLVTALRSNVASPLKHRRRPHTALVRAWLRTLAGVAAVRLVATLDRGPGPVGSRAPGRLRWPLQPRFEPGPPSARPGGPALVLADITEALGGDDVASRGAADALRRLAVVDGRPVEVAAVVRDAAGGLRRAAPVEVARLLGVQHPVQDVPPTALEFDPPAGVDVLSFGTARTR